MSAVSRDSAAAEAGATSRGALWRPVWTDRDDDRADWNGFEACFESTAAYEHWTHQVSDVLRHRLSLTKDDVVADLGCGTGRIASLIAPHVASVLALDYSSTVLEVARKRRGCGNVSYECADLNHFDVDRLTVTKAYAVESLFYLDSEDHVYRLLDGLSRRGVAFAAVDLPDRDVPDQRQRSYDTDLYTHLRFSAERLQRRFPTGTVVRDEFPGYVNGATRFNFYLPGHLLPSTPSAPTSS